MRLIRHPTFVPLAIALLVLPYVQESAALSRYQLARERKAGSRRLAPALQRTTRNRTLQTKHPNILFIMSDDHGAQAISAYGSRLIKTPNIDRIAKEGMRLENCFVTNSICTPSRATILTGKYSHLNG